MADFFSRIIDPFVRRNNWTKQEQAVHYKRQYNVWDRQSDKYGRPTVPASTEMEDVNVVAAGDFQKQVSQLNSFVFKNEQQKMGRLKVWREMSRFAEISFVLGEMEDEAINFDDAGDFINLKIKNQRFLQNENILRNINKEWKYILHDVMRAKNQINEWFVEFLIDGEIFFEKVVDPVNARERGIVRVRRLRPEYTYTIWTDAESDEIYEIYHSNGQNIMILSPDAVAYANSGIYNYPDRFTKEVMSFLDCAKDDYRKLKQMEDALIIYRLVRAPERRVFKIEVGKMPKPKAEQYVQNLMKKYRQRKTYDPSTGEVSQQMDTMAMIEDFWLPSSDGKGSSIETLPGGDNLGQIEDVLFFLDKLFRALRIPMSRVKADTGFSLGDTSDISREEYRFHKMVQKFSNRFCDVFTQIFISHLRLKGYADEYGITEKDFDISLISNNIFEEFMETEIMTKRVDNFERFISYAEPSESGPPMFDKRWLMKRFLKFKPEEVEENENALKYAKKHGTLGGESGGGPSGGGGGGGGSSFGGGSDLGDIGGSDKADKGLDDVTDFKNPDTGESTSDTEKPDKKDNKKDELDSFA